MPVQFETGPGAFNPLAAYDLSKLKLEIGIDKLAIIAKVPKDQLHAYAGLGKSVSQIVKSSPDILSWDGYVKKNGYKHCLRIKVAGTSGNERPLLQFDPMGHSQNGFMRLEFNPANLGESGIKKLKFELDVNTPQGWAAFACWGHVNRIDVCADIGVPIESVIWDSKYRVVRERYLRDGRLETIYLGSKESSKNFTRIYDFNAKNGLAPKPPLTRIERENRTAFPLMEIGQIDNPFKNLRILKWNIPEPDGISPEHWHIFLLHLRRVGINLGLFSWPKAKRSKIKSHLLQHQINEIDLFSAWSGWNDLIAKYGLLEPGEGGNTPAFYNPDLPPDLKKL